MGKRTMALEVDRVVKRVRSRALVNQVSFEVEEGDICGFLGPNGAGKTTLIRIMAGLIKPTEGDVRIAGHSVRNDRVQALSQIGAIVESPIFFSYLTGRQALVNLARLHPELSSKARRSRVEEALEQVGLSDRANDRISTYSLGMKQRLGIAQALLGEPRIVILDEPANGLDPMGMQFLRKQILQLRKERGLTFLISSHLLDEIQQVCDRLVMIRQGSLVWKGRTDELHGPPMWVYRVTEVERALEALPNGLLGNRVGADTFQVEMNEEEAEAVNRRLQAEGILVLGLEKRERRLEEVFIEMMAP
ncbi:ABC-type multidrug transport system ATPase subunit [Desmospora profundinema]|uniref:ABC-type multidrug transport system ATPase subunit n=1 Tax=Desmospora profundinema TaxID=1571184 RepID=A0ABU1ISJ7_9BACL|nr:ABC-type multidrug transport system ATPase subunit [Desmospora profundinema]